LLRSEPLEPRLENGKRLHYNFQFVHYGEYWCEK
jgi:hypothetical protein